MKDDHRIGSSKPSAGHPGIITCQCRTLLVSMIMIGLLTGCTSSRHTGHSRSVSSAHKIDYSSIENAIGNVERNLGATVGVSLYNVETDNSWSYNGNSRFPLMSTFKTLACAKALLDAEEGRVSLDSSVTIEKASLITWSPVTEKYAGKTLSLKQACAAMMIMSDNTAANLVLEKTGGPDALTAFLRTIGDSVTRLDRIEPDLGEARKGDLRDTTTPDSMVKNLHVLLFGDVLSDASRTQLKQWMMDNKVCGSLFRSVLPDKWSIADRSGAGGYGSRGITAVVWPKPGSPLIISVYLTQTESSFDERNKAIAQIGRAIFALYR